ncbi:MAG: aldehyde ferredoxin oxidoreductase family protein [Dehalococcoidia bacterium]|nr:aldehyde ferredoxin oxidoreductase family protein [Dehalococcoidia bacterium]
MAGGYMGKILWVDLSRGKLTEEVPSEKLCKDFLGGYGIGAKLLLDRQQPKADPLGPDNILGFVTGPLTGTPSLFGSRYTVVAKSPLTGTWGDANSGGDFGPGLKFAGFDAVFFTGVSPKPVYLFLNEGKAELKDAAALWGKDAAQTEDALKAELGDDVKLSCIGPSGEKLSLISCIVNNKGRVAGRSGLGAVMGSKKLKAVVAKGKMEVPVADKAKVDEIRKQYLPTMTGFLFDTLKNFGTGGLTAGSLQNGDAPIKNWAGSALDFPNPAAVSDKAITDLQQRKYGCWRCPIACGGLMKKGTKYNYREGVHKPEYETIVAFGGMCVVDDLEAITMANEICNTYGLDTISAGATVAFAVECFEKGLLTLEDTDGIELKWGNAKAMLQMTEKMAKREGKLGDIMADGVKKASEKIKGSEEFAIHIQGQELPMHDPKRFMHYGGTYKGDATPARHTQGSEGYRAPGLDVPAFDKKAFAGRGPAHKFTANMVHVVMSAGWCTLGYQCVDFKAFHGELNAVTGWNLSIEDMNKLGERIANARQAFNVREGLNPVQFQVPGRVSGKTPMAAGPLAGRSVDMETLAKDYYASMDWDVTTGKPSKKKLEELGMHDIAEALYK